MWDSARAIPSGIAQYLMHRHIAVRGRRPGFSVCALADRFEVRTCCRSTKCRPLGHQEHAPLRECRSAVPRRSLQHNQTQFAPPDTALGDNTTGVISSQVNAPRELPFIPEAAVCAHRIVIRNKSDSVGFALPRVRCCFVT